MNWLGDYPEDFTTVAIYFTTHDVNGAPVAPLTGYEAADVTIYKNGSATQKTSTNGVTMTSPFDSVVGLHCVVIDTSNDTADSGFWTTGGGGVYSVVLNPDTETVAGQTTLKVIGTFGICLSPALRPTTAGRTLDVSATGEAGLDWANIGSPTTSVNLSATNINVTQIVASVSGAVGSVTGLTASDVGAIKTKTDFLPSATAGAAGGVFIAGTNAATTVTTSFTTTFTGNLSGSVGSVATGGIAAASFAAGAVDAAALAADAGTEIGTAVWASATRLLTAGTNIVLAKGTGVTGFNDLSAAQVNAEADTALADYDAPTHAELTAELATADDAVLAQVALVKTQTDKLLFTVPNMLDVNIQYVNDVQVNGDGSVATPWGP